jgi:uncharacterized protein
MAGARSTPSTNDQFAQALRGFGLVGLVATLVIFAGNLVIAPLSALLVLAWARRSSTPLRDIGFVRPSSWTRDLLVGLVLGIAFKLLMKSVVMPLLGAPPINQAYHYLVGNTAALPGMFYAVVIGAGFGEETLFRGYLFERLGTLFGRGRSMTTMIVLITATFFGLAHYPEQGLPGVQQATVFGLVFGAIFAVTGGLWMLMVAHAAFDLTALAIIYWDLEAEVAQVFFE